LEDFVMQKRTKMIVAVAAAGLLGTAVVGGAVAGSRGHGGGHGSQGMTHGMGHGMGPGGMGHGMGHGGSGHHGAKGMRHMIKRFAERYDANDDGKISQEEINTNRTEWHKKFDTDGNGTLSLKEFEALWLEAKRQRMVRAFQRLDEDGDAAMTLEEYLEPLSDAVERWDRNGDGVLSREDRRSGRQGMEQPMQQEQGGASE
jgi:Ca2+-binding EF-hand superfamily protein